MMNHDEKEIVRQTYKKLMESEKKGWTELDDNLEMWDWLTNEEMISYTAHRYESHLEKGGVRCKSNHKIEECFAPVIFESVRAILELCKESEYLHPKNRYILLYYLTMSEMKLILAAQ